MKLGQGGFGEVVLGKHKETRKEVAIKFMDISENCKTHYLIYSAIGKYDRGNLQGDIFALKAFA
jgi:serine/threonine protein kinase